ncbi:MAG: hypothetical protein ABIE43_02320 [Patescibacteria group bacterium]
MITGINKTIGINSQKSIISSDKTANNSLIRNNKSKYPINILAKNISNPLWLSVSEAAKIGGVNTKTIRRAIKFNSLSFKVSGNRYFINLTSLILYLYSGTKLKNKLNEFGIGQYIEKWKN